MTYTVYKRTRPFDDKPTSWFVAKTVVMGRAKIDDTTPIAAEFPLNYFYGSEVQQRRAIDYAEFLNSQAQ